MRAHFVGITFWLVTYAVSASATIHFVPDDFINLQEALDECNSNDTIVCRAGTYRGPFVIWNRNVTLASEFILTGDPSSIARTIIRPSPGNRHHRCLETLPSPNDRPQLRISGLTIALGRADSLNEDTGGGIHIQNRVAEISDCVFKLNAANRGGAAYADQSSVLFMRCDFAGNDSRDRGSTIYARRSYIEMDSCDVGPSGTILRGNPFEGEIHLDACSLQVSNTRFHDIGTSGEGRNLFYTFMSSPSPWLKMSSCTTENCNIRCLTEYGGGINRIEIDSCTVRDNTIWWGYLASWRNPALETMIVTNNRFENNRYPANTGGDGLLRFDENIVELVLEGNYFEHNSAATYSCLELEGFVNVEETRAQRNYFMSNSSWGYPTWQSRTVNLRDVAEGVFEFNAMLGNVGFAVSTIAGVSPTSYALHNFWGDSTGPYEATRNPGGLGDTTNVATIYDEWLLSRGEIPDTTLYPPPNAADDRRWTVPSTWFISSVYPNPFNSEIRLELDGMTGADFEVRLFDLLGREVALLHSGRTLRGTLSFHAPSDLAAGVYFLHAKDHLYAETKKVLYLR